jgi:hypothetical protein
LPVRVTSLAIRASRRENAAYRLGRYVMTRASSVRPRPAAANPTNWPDSPLGVSIPIVSIDEPDDSSARDTPRPVAGKPCTDQNSAATPAKISVDQTNSCANTPSGACNANTRSRVS